MNPIRPVAPAGPAAPAQRVATIDGLPGFGDSLEALLRPVGSTGAAAAPPGATGSTGSAARSSDVHFSRHATARLESRGISLESEDLEDLAGAVDQLAKKGARESLIMMGDNAYIVGVPDRKVITVMSRAEAVGNIFTNIDSTLVLR